MTDSKQVGQARPGENAEDIERYPYHRRFVRHKVRVKIDVQTDHSFHAWTQNLSQDGLCFEIPEQIDRGREITVWIFTNGGAGSPPVQARCRVVWNDQAAKGTRHGGKFLFFAGQDQNRLEEWIAALKA
jgi:hypothetical protein